MTRLPIPIACGGMRRARRDDAAIRLDATVLAGIDKNKSGHTTAAIRNLSAAGGSFIVNNTSQVYNLDDDFYGDRRPGYVSNNSMATYLLSGFTNDTNELTTFALLNRQANTAWTGSFHFFDCDAALSAGNNPRAAAAANFHVVMDANRREYINTWDATTSACRFNPGSDFMQPYLMTTLVYPTGNKLNVVYQSVYTNGLSQTMPSAVAVNAATNSAVAYREKLNHTMLSIGNRLTSVASRESVTTVNAGQKNFGEFIAFFRRLSDTEQKRVREYLLWKWFDVKPEEGTCPFRLEVESGAKAVASLKGIDTVEKDGDGTLIIPGVEAIASEKLDVKAGGVTFAPAVIGRKAALWVDASDATAVVTNETGHVVEIRNKGTSGGAFHSRSAGTSKVTRGTSRHAALAMLEWPQDAGLGSVFDNTTYSFDGDAVNRMHTVFAVMAQGDADGDISAYNYNCAFSLGPDPSAIDSSEPTQILRIVGTRPDLNTQPYSLTLGGNVAVLDTFSADGWDETARRNPALIRLETSLTGEGMATLERAADAGSHKLTRLYNSSRFPNGSRRFGMARLGSRIQGNLSAGKIWYGAIGEILVFNEELTFEEKASVTEYLRKRWFSEESPACPPVMCGNALSAGEPGDLALSAGATLVYAGTPGAVADLQAAAGSKIKVVSEPIGDGATVLTFLSGDAQGMSLAAPGVWRLSRKANSLELVMSGTLIIIR